LRRLLIDEQGNAKGELQQGERKSLQTDRVILVPGPPEERLIVERIFRLFVELERSEQQIADLLNRDGVRTDLERLWTRGTVHQ
ncbi:recombinase family protein, partial [Pseudomonas aeruginosa]|uniref:recombinase family protein n=1 Tax=Pseudomonas aeruginosa TaxID=287 RepID=UPI002887EB77